MKFEQIEQVLELAKTGTFSQTARNLYMSQPNLSLSIKQLEDELNCQLFIRSSEGVIPTEEGRQLIEHMAAIQNKYNLIKDFSKNQEPSRLSLRIAMTNLNRTIPHFVRLAGKYMGSPIDFSYINCLTLNDVIDKVVTCQVDFALVGMMEPYVKNTISRFHNYHIEYHPFPRNRIHAIVGPQNPFYKREEPLRMEELSTQTLITFGSEIEDPCSAVYESSLLHLNPIGKIQVNNPCLFYETIQNTPAMGLIPCKKDSFYFAKIWEDLWVLTIPDFPICAENGWIKLRRMPLSDIASEFISELHSVF